MDVTSAQYGPDPGEANSFVLTTLRLDIRPPDPGRAAELYQLVAGPEGRPVTDNLLWDGPESTDDIAEYAARGRTAPYERWGRHWWIHDRTGEITGSAGAVIGAVGLRMVVHPGRADLGYWLAQRYWRRGIMTEALGAVLAHCFEAMRLIKIEAGVFPGNVASARLLEKMGFLEEGYVRSAYLKRGRPVDSVKYGLTIERWLGLPRP